MIVGLETANEGIEVLEDPGIEFANRTLAKLALTKTLLTEPDLSPEQAALLVHTSAKILAVGTPLGRDPDAQDPVAALLDDVQVTHRARTQFASYVDRIEVNDATDTQKMALKEASAKAATAAKDALDPCRIRAFDISNAVADAERELENASDEAERVTARATLERWRSEAQAAIAMFSMIPSLLDTGLRQARTGIETASRDRKPGGNIPAGVITQSVTDIDETATDIKNAADILKTGASCA